MSVTNQDAPAIQPTFQELKKKYANAFYLVELANQKAGYLKIDDINGPNFNEKLKVAFHMIKSPQYALADENKKIISEVTLNNADMAAILKNAQEQSANDKDKISELEAKLAAYQSAQNGGVKENPDENNLVKTPVVKKSAADKITEIAELETVEDIEKYISGETAATVLKAAEKRIAAIKLAANEN